MVSEEITKDLNQMLRFTHLCSEPFFIGGIERNPNPEFIESEPRFDRNGEKITNPYTYKVLEALERVLWEISTVSFFPHATMELHVTIKYSEGNYAKDGSREGYWAQVDIDGPR